MDRRLLWRRWLAYVTAGELCGFAVPAAVGVATVDAPASAQIALMTGTGLVEGAFLGLAQAAVMNRELPALNRRAWVVVTAVAAGLAWLLGMLPGATYEVWSSWPAAATAVGGVTIGVLLLGSIGLAQALVLPAGTTRRWSWVGWTALGWSAGLSAFSVVAPPLWHPGQSVGARVLVGLAGGVAMATVMAAVTGVGMVRLVARSRSVKGTGVGRHLVSTLLGSPAYTADGHVVGALVDLLVDLGSAPDRTPVTGLLVRSAYRGRELFMPGSADQPSGVAWVLGARRERQMNELTTTELLVKQDILDSPVITTVPPGRVRVSDVVVETYPGGGELVGLDLSQAGAFRRLIGRATWGGPPREVPLSAVHLLSRRGHAAQLAAPDGMVHRITPQAMAEVLTRASVDHARDIVEKTDADVGRAAVRLLHPEVRDRVTGEGAPPRRLLRHRGWRLHSPSLRSRGGR